MQKTAGALSEAVPLSSRRRTGGEWLEPATLPHHEQAMPRNRAKRDAKNSRSAERGCSSVLTPPNRRRMVWSPQPCPTTSRLCRAIARSAMQKNSRSAERGCVSVLPPPNRRRMVEARNPALPPAGYAAQSRSDAQTALLPKTQPAAPYAAETSRYVPPLYTYPTKFMHNLCHIVM